MSDEISKPENFHEKMKRKQLERIEEFAALGIKAQRGTWAGFVQVDAANAEKLLRILRRAAKE